MSDTRNSTISEFYDVQERFHRNMKELVIDLERMSEKFDGYNREKFEEFIQPYKVLVNNPFREEKQKNEDAINHINETILNDKKQNGKEFQAEWAAYTKIAAAMESFRKFLQENFDANERVLIRSAEVSKTGKSDIGNEVIRPISHFPKINGMLQEIQKKAFKSEDKTSQAIQKINQLSNKLEEKLDKMSKGGPTYVAALKDSEVKSEMKYLKEATKADQKKTPLSSRGIFSTSVKTADDKKTMMKKMKEMRGVEPGDKRGPRKG